MDSKLIFFKKKIKILTNFTPITRVKCLKFTVKKSLDLVVLKSKKNKIKLWWEHRSNKMKTQ